MVDHDVPWYHRLVGPIASTIMVMRQLLLCLVIGIASAFTAPSKGPSRGRSLYGLRDAVLQEANGNSVRLGDRMGSEATLVVLLRHLS